MPAGRSPENPFVSFFANIVNPGVPRELWSQLRPWLQRLAMDVPRHAAPLGAPQYCDHVTRGGNGCDHMAVLVCRACGESVCLKHSYVGAGGRCVCAQCVSAVAAASREDARDEQPKNRRNAGKRRRAGWTPPHGEYEYEPEPSARDARADALSTLGLPLDATLETITARFRELSKAYHPDKFTDPRDKAAADERFRKLSAAYSLLMKQAA